jgi:hypothetical protein
MTSVVYHCESSVENIIYPVKLLGCLSVENSFHRLKERTLFGPEDGHSVIIEIGFSDTSYPIIYHMYDSAS